MKKLLFSVILIIGFIFGSSAQHNSISGSTTGDNNSSYSSCLDFDGQDDIVNLGNVLNNVISGTGKQFTIEFLMKLGVTDSYQTIMAKFDAGTNQRQFILRSENISGNHLAFIFYNSLSGMSNYRKLVSSTALNVEQWYHIAVVYDGTLNTNNGLDRVKFYVNGQLDPIQSSSANGPLVGIPAGTAPLNIGGSVYGGAPAANGSSFDGILKNARIWSCLRTPEELQSLMFTQVPDPMAQPNLKLNLLMDEGSGQVLSDVSSSGLTGYLGMNASPTANDPAWTSCTPPVQDEFPNCLDFDGINDYVNAGVKPGFDMDSQMTIEAWIYPEGPGSGGSAGSGGIIVSKEGEYELARFENGYIGWAFGNVSPGWSWRQTTAFVPLHQWSHVAMTYGNNFVLTYLNGILQHSYPVSGSIGDVAPTLNDLWISGRQSLVNGQIFDGKMDEVRIWNVIRSEAQIREEMHREIPGPLTAEGLVAYYRFDQTGGTVAHDHSASGYSGILTNMDALNDWEVSTAPLPYNTVANGNWENNVNWNTGQNVPVNEWARIRIDHNIISNTDIRAIDLEISSTGSLVVNPSFKLTVSGILSNEAGTGGLILKSDATGTATVIENSGVEATAERFFPGFGTEWHLVSSPVSGAQSDIFTGMYLQWFKETSNQYLEIIPTNVMLNPGHGYAVYSTLGVSNTVDFTGNLNKGSFSIPVTRTATAPYGWNLIGNPYPSGIDWNQVIPSLSGINHTIYYLDAATGNWLTWNGTTGSGIQFIPPQQGFFVSASANSVLHLEQAYRTHKGSWLFYKDEVPNLAVISVSGNGLTDKTYICFDETATPAFDGRFDGYKIISSYNPELPQVYTQAGKEKLSINVLPVTSAIPLAFEAGICGNYRISLDKADNMDYVILEDKMTGFFTNLKQTDYLFIYSVKDQPERFVLHFTPVAQSIVTPDDLNIYSANHQIIVDAAGFANGQVSVSDLTGKIMMTGPVNGGSLNILTPEVNPGIYFVRVQTGDKTFTRKVMIQ